MTQKDAVFSAIVETFDGDNISFQPDRQDAYPLLTRRLRTIINNRLAAGFADGNIDISDEARSKLGSDRELKAYISGLVSNWVRKDPRLNGGRTAAKPQVVDDPQLKALIKLQGSQTDPAKKLEIQDFIDKRNTELGG